MCVCGYVYIYIYIYTYIERERDILMLKLARHQAKNKSTGNIRAIKTISKAL